MAEYFLASEKLPQNVHALIGEIGEKQVLLRLFLLVRDTPWNVFHNLGEAGFDLLLMHSKTGEKIRIEVKTRQKLYTTGKHPNRVHFMLTDKEYQSSDFLIGYLLDTNDFYIVPKMDLKRAQTDGKVRWRIIVTLTKTGEPHPRFQKNRNAWYQLHPDFSTNTPAAEFLDETNSEPIAELIEEEVEQVCPEDYWPELAEAVRQREEERLQVLGQMNAHEFVENMESELEKLFQERDIQASLGENLEKMKMLANEWDPPVFKLVKTLAEASKLNTIWTIKTKVVVAPQNHSHSLLWEVQFRWMASETWYNVELELDSSYNPLRFRVECKKPHHWLESEPNLDGLKSILAKAYTLGKVHENGRKEKQGWILRTERGKRY